MSFINWLNRTYEERGPMKWLAFFLELISAIVLFLLMALTCIDVVGRYFFSHPLVGATELTEIGLALVIFSVMPIITWRSTHIVVDLIDMIASLKLLKILAWFSTLLIASSFYFVAIRIFELGTRNLHRGIVTDFLHLPIGYFIQAIALFSWIACFGLLLCSLLQVIGYGDIESKANKSREEKETKQ